MSNTVAKDERWMSQSGTTHPDNTENKRISQAESLSTYAPSGYGSGGSENGRITYVKIPA